MATTLTVLLVGEPERDTFIVVAIDRAGHERHHPFAHRPHEVGYAAELAHRETAFRVSLR